MKRDYRDITAGGAILALGIFFAAYAAQNYDLGTLRRMGPGAFPFGVGLVLTGLGLLIALPACLRTGQFTPVATRPALAVLAGLAAFAIVVRPLGLMPAIAALVVVSSLAETRPSWKAMLGVTLVVGGLVYLVFSVALGLPFSMFNWPF